MFKKTILFIIITSFSILFTSCSNNNSNNNNNSINSTQNQTPYDVLYIDDKNNILTVKFDNSKDTITFKLPELDTITLLWAVSASGMKYANTNWDIVFWEHQGELIITKNEKEIFKGKVKK